MVELGQVLQALLDDRQSREKELAEERKRRDAEMEKADEEARKTEEEL